jgi:hypothetical protein
LGKEKNAAANTDIKFGSQSKRKCNLINSFILFFLLRDREFGKERIMYAFNQRKN